MVSSSKSELWASRKPLLENWLVSVCVRVCACGEGRERGQQLILGTQLQLLCAQGSSGKTIVHPRLLLAGEGHQFLSWKLANLT